MRMAFKIHGRVQGVGYRYFVCERAQCLGLAGWVCNEYDGTVTGEVAGEPLLLEELAEDSHARFGHHPGHDLRPVV